MKLIRYAIEAGAIADELRMLLVGDLGVAAMEILADADAESLFRVGPLQESEALSLLAQTPAQRTKTLGKLDDRAAALLVLRARYAALCSCRAIRLADELRCIPGSSYRSAAARAAEAVRRVYREPSLDELLPPLPPPRTPLDFAAWGGSNRVF